MADATEPTRHGFTPEQMDWLEKRFAARAERSRGDRGGEVRSSLKCAANRRNPALLKAVDSAEIKLVARSEALLAGRFDSWSSKLTGRGQACSWLP